jgi:hypothetical protein
LPVGILWISTTAASMGVSTSSILGMDKTDGVTGVAAVTAGPVVTDADTVTVREIGGGPPKISACSGQNVVALERFVEREF